MTKEWKKYLKTLGPDADRKEKKIPAPLFSHQLVTGIRKGAKAMKKHLISVRQGGSSFDPGPEVGQIRRVLRAEMIGNFNPIFCTYNGKRALVHSIEGDLADPFRREESYLASLFIIQE